MVNAIGVTITILSASTWLSAAVASLSPQYGASFINPPCVGGARPAFTRRHREKAQLNQFRWRLQNIGISPLGASEKRESDVTSITTTTKPTKRRRSWEESYALLCAYEDTHGHCNVPQSQKPLGTWVNRQRIEHARYILRNELLHNEGGDNKDDDGTLPSTSMNARRKNYLDAIDFVWDAMGHTWNIRYAELCEFQKSNGHCVVPRSYGRLGAWVEKQRIEYKKYRAKQLGENWENDEAPKTILTENRVHKMDEISFVWDVREKQFEEKLGQLRILKEVNGNIDPRFMNGQLALWVRKYEQQYRKYLEAAATGVDDKTLSGILPENRLIALENVGFCRSMFDIPRARSVGNRRASWEERYKELVEYKNEHGHCVVPKNYGPLGSWVRAQRHLMKEKETEGSSFESDGLLSQERVSRLDRLGFVWDVHQWQWNQKYHELLLYKVKHNDVNVPMSYGGLGLWVFNQRAHYNSYRKGKRSAMTPTRLELLKNIGFEFDLGQRILSAADDRWQLRLSELKEYQEKWGSFNVKQDQNPSLYNWCQHQKARLLGKKTSLKKEREDALLSIGFLDTQIT